MDQKQKPQIKEKWSKKNQYFYDFMENWIIISKYKINYKKRKKTLNSDITCNILIYKLKNKTNQNVKTNRS